NSAAADETCCYGEIAVNSRNRLRSVVPYHALTLPYNSGQWLLRWTESLTAKGWHDGRVKSARRNEPALVGLLALQGCVRGGQAGHRGPGVAAKPNGRRAGPPDQDSRSFALPHASGSGQRGRLCGRCLGPFLAHAGGGMPAERCTGLTASTGHHARGGTISS